MCVCVCVCVCVHCSIKRLIGRQFNDKTVQHDKKLLPCKYTYDEHSWIEYTCALFVFVQQPTNAHVYMYVHRIQTDARTHTHTMKRSWKMIMCWTQKVAHTLYINKYENTRTHTHTHTRTRTHTHYKEICIYTHIFTSFIIKIEEWSQNRWVCYGVATISRLLKIVGLFCRIFSRDMSFNIRTYAYTQTYMRIHTNIHTHTHKQTYVWVCIYM